LAHRHLRCVESIGVDEIHWGRGLKADNFLTVIYQIDAGCRRLLWVGRRRSQATLRRGLKALEPEVVKGLRFVCSDMWRPYLKVNGEEPIMRRKTRLGNKEGFSDPMCSP
jgi:transposase